jgi:endonuclease V-like protein UPF0215 family
MLISKPAFRVLGISECFRKHAKKSVLAAIVYRRDGYIDGVYFTFTSIGGMDATDSILGLYKSMNRKDINVIMLNGCIISWFNIVDLKRLNKETGLPVICVSYEESKGIEKYIREYFPGDTQRINAYRGLGQRQLVYVRPTQSYVYVRAEGLSLEEARQILDATTKTGKVPEPLRISQMIARAVHTFLEAADPLLLGIQPPDTGIHEKNI